MKHPQPLYVPLQKVYVLMTEHNSHSILWTSYDNESSTKHQINIFVNFVKSQPEIKRFQVNNFYYFLFNPHSHHIPSIIFFAFIVLFLCISMVNIRQSHLIWANIKLNTDAKIICILSDEWYGSPNNLMMMKMKKRKNSIYWLWWNVINVDWKMKMWFALPWTLISIKSIIINWTTRKIHIVDWFH